MIWEHCMARHGLAVSIFACGTRAGVRGKGDTSRLAM
jgi:hypothetical protein